MKKFKVFCETDNKWEYVISNTAPTECPVNPGHTIKVDSVCIVKKEVTANDVDATVPLLADYKQLKNDEIDTKTGELILQGFEYPASSGQIFSFSSNGQRNLIGAFAGRDALTYPFSWNTKDDLITIQLADATEMSNFYFTALGTKKAHQDSGNALKASVLSATTKAEVDAVIDNR